MVTQGIIEMDLDAEDPFEESYDYEESVLSRDRRKRPFYATKPPPYYRPGPTHHGTMTAPGSSPVPVRFGENFVRADQMQTALSKVQNDVLELASAIQVLKTGVKTAQGGGGINSILPLLLMGGQPAPEIDKITFSDDNTAPFDTAGEVTVSKTTYKPQQKSNLGLIIAMTTMMGGDSKDQSGLLIALALSGGLGGGI